MSVFFDVFTLPNVIFAFKGLLVTLLFSVLVVLVSVALGAVLALLRNYERILLGRIAGVYIEIFRNTPLLLWILFCIFLMRTGSYYYRAGVAYVLFTSSVIAEIVRGGLNSIAAGQFEAAASQGFTKMQTIVYIVLPQTFYRIIPSLMSQIVTTVKDTSFLSQFAIAEFFFSSKHLINTIPQSRGVPITAAHVIVIFAFIALVYFLINFALSSLARRIRINRF